MTCALLLIDNRLKIANQKDTKMITEVALKSKVVLKK